jgi:L-asparaginase II
VIAKVGAAGVYGAALLEEGLGVALKVEDGDTTAARPALLAVLRALVGEAGFPLEGLRGHGEIPIRNTRGIQVGTLRAEGTLHGLDRQRARSARGPAISEV